MPQVATLERSTVGGRHPVGSRHRLQQREMGRFRCVPAGDQPVDDARRVSGAEHESGPPCGRLHHAVDDRGLEGPGYRRADGDDAPPGPPDLIDLPGRLRRHTKPLGLGRFTRLLR